MKIDNVGEKIKKLAKILFVIEIVLAAITAIIFFIVGITAESTTIILSSVISIAFFIFIAYLTFLVMYAIAETHEKVIGIEKTINASKKIVTKNTQAYTKTTPKTENTQNNVENKPAQRVNFCSSCGADVTNDNSVCHVCNHEL